MANPTQKFCASFLKTSKFEKGVLRDYFVDRDLGMAEATGGLVTALVHRACKPCPPGGTGRHQHDIRFQMVYVLKGSCVFEFEGQGPIRFEAGDSWLQPPSIKHTVLDYSDDLELLEIVMPAEFDTRDA